MGILIPTVAVGLGRKCGKRSLRRGWKGRGRCVTITSGAFKQGKGGVVSIFILEIFSFWFFLDALV